MSVQLYTRTAGDTTILHVDLRCDHPGCNAHVPTIVGGQLLNAVTARRIAVLLDWAVDQRPGDWCAQHRPAGAVNDPFWSRP